MNIVNFSDELWEKYRPSIIAHFRKSSPIPPKLETIYVQLATQQKAFVIGDNGSDFAIIHIEPYLNNPSLWIDEAYSTMGDGFSHYINDFITIAKTIPDCHYIRWQSARKGYLKSFKGLKEIGDYEIEYIVYRLDITKETHGRETTKTSEAL